MSASRRQRWFRPKEREAILLAVQRGEAASVVGARYGISYQRVNSIVRTLRASREALERRRAAGTWREREAKVADGD